MPYQVVNDLTLPSGKTLTINAGVVVKFEAVDVTYGSGNRRNLIVGGTLNLLSTPSQKVVFTSSRDDDYGGDTNGDGTGSHPRRPASDLGEKWHGFHERLPATSAQFCFGYELVALANRGQTTLA